MSAIKKPPDNTRNAPEAIRILLLEDDQDDSFLLNEMLGWDPRRIYEIEHCVTLKEMVEAGDGSYDIMMIDLKLPDSSGLDTLQAVISLKFDLPIIVFTGASSELLGEKAIAMGAQDYLVKGRITTDLLVKSIAYAIERDRLIRHKMPHRDPVTLLPTGEAMHERLRYLIHQFDRSKVNFALACLSPNNLTSTQKYWGKDVGDTLLALIAQRLEKNKRASDMVAYFGNQVFALVLVGCNEEIKLRALLNKKLAILEQEYIIDLDQPDQDLKLDFCIGACNYEQGFSLEKFLARAEETHQRAKSRHQKNSIALAAYN